jgi:uncharacterized protein (TIGR02466 family)
MDIQTPFITPIALFDLSKHLPLLRNIFKYATQQKLFNLSKAGYDTTLSMYAIGRDEDCLPLNDETTELKQDITNAAVELAAFMGYATNNYQPTIKNFWLNEMVSGVEHPVHSHYGVHFSGCFYVDVPDSSGNIVFSSHRERYDYQLMRAAKQTVYNSGTWTFNPKEGQLFLWESWIRHCVPAATFEGVRRTAALDVTMNIKG